MKDESQAKGGDPIFERLSEVKVLAAVQELKATVAVVKKEWDEEVAKYEETMTIETIHGVKSAPRRNYPNKLGTIEDPQLFPYHTICYPLLSWYDTFDDTHGILCKDAILPLVDLDDEEDSNAVLDDMPPEIRTSYNAMGRIMNDARLSSTQTPPQMVEANDIFLKLLKHALSDLHCDHFLASILVKSFQNWKSFTDLFVFRRFLAIILTEKRACNGRCGEFDDAGGEEGDVFPDHDCPLWQSLETDIGTAMCHGMDMMTEEHALMIGAFFKMTLDEANPSVGESEDEIIANQGSGSQVRLSHKERLKLSLYLHNQAEYEEDSEPEHSEKEIVPFRIFYALLDAFDSMIKENQRRCILDEASNLTPTLRSMMFRVSVGLLVYFGETAVRRIPAKLVATEMCSKFIRNLVTIYCGPTNYEINRDAIPHDTSYRIYHQTGISSILDSDRYARRIYQSPRTVLDPSKTDLARLNRDESTAQTKPSFIPSTPDDVFDVIRCLFGRGLVEIQDSGCGYGDCLVWMGGKIIANDPFLFIHSDNYNYHGESTQDIHAWVSESSDALEVPCPLLDDKLEACYDLSLVKLLQAWYSPWSPESHHSFQRPFQAGVKTLTLCCNRLDLPNDVTRHICQFLPRTFWPDDRARCWCEDCIVENSTSLMFWKLGGKRPEDAPKLSVTKQCPVCKVNWYKNTEHRKTEAGNHRKNCNKPPCRIPGQEEAQFCKLVAAKIAGHDVEDNDDDVGGGCHDDENDNGEGFDDEGSWESIDSDAEEDSRTSQLVSSFIFDWFNQKTYKSQRSQETGFEALYNREE